MAIYKAFTDNDEMSKSLCMKKYLGWSDEEIKENYTSLILDKQWTAVADMMSHVRMAKSSSAWPHQVARAPWESTFAGSRHCLAPFTAPQ